MVPDPPPPTGGPPGGGPPPSDPALTTGTLEVFVEPTADGMPARVVRTRSAWGPGGWGRRMAKLWGFLAFCILVLFLARHVVLPFIFALLVAYSFAPIVNRMSRRRDGGKRMPRGLAIILCYIVLLTAMAAFMLALLPRLYKALSRLGKAAPS